MKQVLDQAREGRLYILNKMRETISEPEKISQDTPQGSSAFKSNRRKFGISLAREGKIFERLSTRPV